MKYLESYKLFERVTIPISVGKRTRTQLPSYLYTHPPTAHQQQRRAGGVE